YHCLRVYDPDGTELRMIGGTAGKEPGQFGYVSDAVQDADGFFYLSEFGENDRVTKLDAEGRVVAGWGEGGGRPGQLSRPWALAVDRRGRVHVIDTENHRVQRVKF